MFFSYADMQNYKRNLSPLGNEFFQLLWSMANLHLNVNGQTDTSISKSTIIQKRKNAMFLQNFDAKAVDFFQFKRRWKI